MKWSDRTQGEKNVAVTMAFFICTAAIGTVMAIKNWHKERER